MTFRLIYFAFSLLLCRAATAQIVYDGFELAECEICFSHAEVRNGEFKLQFDSKIDRDSPEGRWIRSGSHYLGWRVTFEQNNGRQEAVFNPVFANESSFRLPLGDKVRRFIFRGAFSREGRGDELVTAHIGDRFIIGGISATVRRLDRFEAELQLSSTGTILTLIISSTGELRSQQYLLKDRLYRLEVEQRQSQLFRKCLLYFGGTSIFLFLVYGLFYLFIFIGMWQLKFKPRTLCATVGK